MDIKEKKFPWRNWTFYCILLILTLAFVAGQLWGVGEKEKNKEDDIFFHGDITWIASDGTRSVVQQNSQVFWDENEALVFELTVPEDAKDNTFIAFRSKHSSVKIWLDDEMILDRDYTRDATFMGSNPSLYNFVPISREDAGKVIHVESKAEIGASSGRFYTFYQGTEMEIWKDILFSTGFETIIAILIAIGSLMLIVGVRMMNTIFQAEKSLEYLGICLFLFSVNLVLDAGVRQLLFRNVLVAFQISLLLYPLMAWAFAKYIQSVQERRYSLFYKIVDFVEIILFFVYVILQLTGIRTFLQCMTFILLETIVVMIGCIVTMVIDIIKKRSNGIQLIYFGMIAFVPLSLLILIGTEFVNVSVENIILILLIGFTIIVGTKKAMNDVMAIETERKIAAMANETKTMFLATMSHDLRTPINTVMGMNELILRENPADPINRYALSIQRASRNLVDLVNDILDFSKMEDGMLEINESNYNLGIVIADLSNMIKEKAMEKKLELNINVQSSLPKVVRGDEKRVKQIITNVLTNAVKYTDKGSVNVNITGTVSPDNMLLMKVEVADTGQGIKAENLERMFESFVRLEEKINMSIDGLGLGLTIAKKLLVAMEGTIDVKSEFGKGSTFTIHIPQRVVDATEIGTWGVQVKAKEEESEEYTPMLEAPDAEILAVDDNRMNLTVLKGLLRPTKVKVTLAKSGQECLDICKDKKFDLIFMDHMMPEIDGIETLHRLNELWRENGLGCPVVALTANAISGAREMYMREGFTDYMTKPVEAVELEKTLVRYLPKSKLSGNYSGLR